MKSRPKLVDKMQLHNWKFNKLEFRNKSSEKFSGTQ